MGKLEVRMTYVVKSDIAKTSLQTAPKTVNKLDGDLASLMHAREGCD